MDIGGQTKSVLWFDYYSDPDAHDVSRMAGALACPLVVVHGGEDPTVDASHAHVLADRAGASPHIIEGGNHVFNVANPFPVDGEPSAQLRELSAVFRDALDQAARKRSSR